MMKKPPEQNKLISKEMCEKSQKKKQMLQIWSKT